MSYRATALLTDLEPSAARQLKEALNGMGHQTACAGDSVEHVDIVFCGSDPQTLARTLSAVRQELSDVPVVAVGHEATESYWLDILEQGATDYLCTPCERTQVRWLLESNLHWAPDLVEA